MGEELLEQARAVAALHYDLAHAEVGPEVLGVWLVGSAILGDLTPASDIDTVTLTTHPVQPRDHRAIGRAHAALGEAFPAVRHDTVYLSLSSLARPPEPGLVTPHTLDGQLRLDEPCGEVHAVTWFTLPAALPAAGGVAPPEVRILADRLAAEEHARLNLQRYWAEIATQVRRQTTGREPAEVLDSSDAVVWLTLGAARLAAFLAGTKAHGPVPSKSEAGRWVVRRVPGQAGLARRALRSRAGHPEVFTVADVRAASDLVMLLVHGHG